MTTPASNRRIGYYVHHVGSGHRHRAGALAEQLRGRGIAVTGLSSAEPPAGWADESADGWVRLERDDQPTPDPHADVTAHGRLHWAPLGHAGARRRTAQLSAWLDDVRPDLVVSDVSQEVTLLARLHGVPVVSVLLPGRRDDAAHALGLGVSEEVVGFWPARAQEAGPGMSAGLPDDVAQRVRALGGQSRFAPAFPVAPAAARPGRARHLVVLAGTGGGAERLERAAGSAMRALQGWTCQVVGGSGAWVEEPFRLLREADVVLTHAGQNAVAEVAAARVPAVVVPQDRPFDEQRTTARVLGAGGWPVVVADGHDGHDGAEGVADARWAARVERAAGLDGAEWAPWVDGGAAERFADVVEAVLA